MVAIQNDEERVLAIVQVVFAVIQEQQHKYLGKYPVDCFYFCPQVIVINSVMRLVHFSFLLFDSIM